MARAPRGASGLIFLAFALVALTAIALVPRGVVRTVAANQLVVSGAPGPPAGINNESSRQVHLPGVRAMVSREDQDDPAATAVEHLVAVQLGFSVRIASKLGQDRSVAGLALEPLQLAFPERDQGELGAGERGVD